MELKAMATSATTSKAVRQSDEVRERPITFSAPMVRAILEGRKTQTRRVVNPQPLGRHTAEEGCVTFDLVNGLSRVRASRGRNEAAAGRLNMHPFHPYGVPGDRLWVRETFYVDHMSVSEGGPLPDEMPDGWDEMLYYRADGECCQQIPECACAEMGKPKWRPPRWMKKWASRISLEITSVRVERLQDIKAHDVWKEGFEPAMSPGVHINIDGELWPAGERYLREVFSKSWDTINAKRGYSWESTPWVWVIEFKRVEIANP
jgi:hypothetical protein